MTSHVRSLLEPLQPATKITITEHFWGTQPSLRLPEAYWNFFVEECRRALDDGGSRNLARTHHDLIEIVTSLKSGHVRRDTQDLLRQKLTKLHENELQLIDGAIDLCASLLLMTDFGQAEHYFSGRRKLDWTSGKLDECVSLGFDRTSSLEHKGIKLERTFNAESLNRLSGLRIIPTTNLLDHLRLTNDDTKVHIFHHASFLNYQLERYATSCCTLRGTLTSKALFYPMAWLKRLCVHLLSCFQGLKTTNLASGIVNYPYNSHWTQSSHYAVTSRPTIDSWRTLNTGMTAW